MPHTVQLVARQVLVDVAGLDDVGVLQARTIQLVAVVGDVDLLLAFELPVVAVRRTVVHVEVVGGTQTVGGGTRTVVGHLRSAAHAALAGVVEPGQARFLHLVEGFVHQQHVTGQAGRRRHALLEVEQHVARLVGIVVLQLVAEGELVLEVHQTVGAVRLRGRLGHQTANAAAAIAGDVVPDRFQAVLRNREGVGGSEVFQTVATFHQFGVGGVVFGGLDHVRRNGGRAVGLVHRHLVGVGVALEHRQLAGGQLVLVLVGVLRGDGEQRLLAGERVRQEATGIDGAGILRQAAGPLGNGAIGVAGFLGAQRSQGGAQLGRFVGGHGRHDAGGQQGQRQCAGLQQTFCCFHFHRLPQDCSPLRSSRRS
ncbi:hypothetical protein D9M71_128070 [compost metagenome]